MTPSIRIGAYIFNSTMIPIIAAFTLYATNKECCGGGGFGTAAATADGVRSRIFYLSWLLL